MRLFRFNGVLALLVLAASMLAAGCRADATPTLLPTPDVDLERNIFSVDLPISATAYLYGFPEGEQIEVKLWAADGSRTFLSTTSANEGGLGSVDIRHDGLPEGYYSVVGVGDQGNKASASLFVKLAQYAQPASTRVATCVSPNGAAWCMLAGCAPRQRRTRRCTEAAYKRVEKY